MPREIIVKKLTPEAFSKYGKVILLRPREKPFDDSDMAIYWSSVVAMEKNMDHYVSLLVEKKRKLELTKMERHVKCLEFFIPVDGDCVAAFAPGRNPDDPNERPNPEEIEIFRMQGLIGFVVNRGTWHWPAFPLTDTATQLIVMRQNLETDDVEVKDLPEPFTIKV